MDVEIVYTRKYPEEHKALLILCIVPSHKAAMLIKQSARDSFESYLNNRTDHGVFTRLEDYHEELIEEIRENGSFDNIHKFYDPLNEYWLDKWDASLGKPLMELHVDLCDVEHKEGWYGWVRCFVIFLQDHIKTAGVLALISKENVLDILDKEPENRILVMDEMPQEFQDLVDGENFYIGFEEVSLKSGFFAQGKEIMLDWKRTYPCVELFKTSTDLIPEEYRAKPFSFMNEDGIYASEGNSSNDADIPRSEYTENENENSQKELDLPKPEVFIKGFNKTAVAFIILVVLYFIFN